MGGFAQGPKCISCRDNDRSATMARDRGDCSFHRTFPIRRTCLLRKFARISTHSFSLPHVCREEPARPTLVRDPHLSAYHALWHRLRPVEPSARRVDRPEALLHLRHLKSLLLPGIAAHSEGNPSRNLMQVFYTILGPRLARKRLRQHVGFLAGDHRDDHQVPKPRQSTPSTLLSETMIGCT